MSQRGRPIKVKLGNGAIVEAFYNSQCCVISKTHYVVVDGVAHLLTDHANDCVFDQIARCILVPDSTPLRSGAN